MRHIAALLLSLATLSLARPASAQIDVDLKLVFAVDISMSMDPDEQRLQREGYVQAFRDPFIHAAIASGKHRRIAVTYFEWAGPTIQNILVPWRLIDTPESANALAAELLAQPYTRRSRTSISGALLFARTLLQIPDFRADRQVIDVSGDGVNNSGPLMALVRPQIIDAGITINGLPVLVRPTMTWTGWDAPHLDLYYASCVIGGPGAFSIAIKNQGDFSTATRQKLLREIATIAPSNRHAAARLIPAQAEPRPETRPDGPTHCLNVQTRIEQRPAWGD